MIRSILQTRYRRLILVVLLALISAICLVQPYDRLYLPAQAQPSTSKPTGPAQEEKLPRIKQVLFARTDGTSYWIKQASLVPADSGFGMDNMKTLYSGYWGEGTSEYKMSPNGKHLLVSQEVPSSDVSREHSNLLLVPVPTGKTKTLRGDEAGYQMLGWSSDGQLISYVSPITIPFSNALAPAPSGFQLISYVSNQSGSQSYYEPPDRILYISAADGKRRRKVQAEVTDAVWIPGHQTIVYTSYDKPGLVVYSASGKRAVLSESGDGGQLLLSGNGKRLLWASGSELRLLQIPTGPSRLLDPTAWKTIATFDVDPNYFAAAGGLSSDGTMVTLLGSGKGGITLLAVLNLLTGKSLVYSSPMGVPYRWSQDDHYLIGAVLRYGGRSADLGAVRVDPSLVDHSGPINWDNPQPVTPRILLEMPPRTTSITWSESE